MRFGIRLQLVLALFALLVLAFLPLFAAVARLTQMAFFDVRESSARSLGRAVAAHVAEASRRRDSEALRALVDAQLGFGGVAAIGVYDETGQAISRAGDPDAVEALPGSTPIHLERVRALPSFRGSAIEVIVPGPHGAVATILRTDDAGATAPLLRLVGLYTAVIALSLLVFTYIALGRLIVRPLDALSSAARRVANGARNLDAPRSGPAELLDLSASLAEMTTKLRADEQRMREQIRELERRANELREAQDHLVRSERLASVGRLAAGLAHEIGNPLAAIMGLHDILLDGDLEPVEQRDFLRRTRAEAERIHVILRDLLDFARPAAGDAAGGQPSDAAEAIADVLALVRPQKAFRDIQIDCDAIDGPLMVALPRTKLVQVVLNLLLNAADAIEGAGRIRIQAHEGNDGIIRIAVEDDGRGVPSSIRSRLFEPFVTTKDIGKGTGLGLAVCRGLIEAAGGTITLDESHSSGARFVIELPAMASEQERLTAS